MSKIITSIVLAAICYALASFCHGFPTCPAFVTGTSGMVAGALLGLILG